MGKTGFRGKGIGYRVRARTVYMFLLSTVICQLSTSITGCAKKEAALKSAEKDDNIEQKISSFNLAGYGEGAKKKWEIEGKAADVFEDVVQLDGITAKAYGEGRQMTVNADKGSVNKSTNNIHLENNVVATTSDGATLKTDYLDWDPKKETVVTDAGVVITKDNMTTQGKGAVAQPELKKVKLKEDVIVRIEPSPKRLTPDNASAPGGGSMPAAFTGEGGPVVITCTGALDADYANNVAVFNDNVKVKDTRSELAADKMIVYFDQRTQRLIKVMAKGNVRISQNDNVSTGDEAEYSALENKIKLSGTPKLVLYPQEKK